MLFGGKKQAATAGSGNDLMAMVGGDTKAQDEAIVVEDDAIVVEDDAIIVEDNAVAVVESAPAPKKKGLSAEDKAILNAAK